MPPKKSKSAKSRELRDLREHIDTELDRTQKYIERIMRIGKLDALLLFSSSSLGLIFILANIVEGIEGVLYLSPILIVGWIMPVYVGYIRGALTVGYFRERMRGWIYLIVGTPFYLFNSIALRYTAKLNLMSRVEAAVFVAPLIMVAGIILYLISIRWIEALSVKIGIVITHESSKAYAESCSYTLYAAITLALLCSLTSLFLVSDKPFVGRFAFFVVSVIIGGWSFRHLENKARDSITRFKEKYS